MSNEPILIPFGPTREVPPGHRWCMACDGEGTKYHGQEDEPRTCEICHGKGYWNADDIDAYHKASPEACQASCGDQHRRRSYLDADPDRWKRSSEEERMMEKARAILRKYGASE